MGAVNVLEVSSLFFSARATPTFISPQLLVPRLVIISCSISDLLMHIHHPILRHAPKPLSRVKVVGGSLVYPGDETRLRTPTTIT